MQQGKKPGGGRRLRTSQDRTKHNKTGQNRI